MLPADTHINIIREGGRIRSPSLIVYTTSVSTSQDSVFLAFLRGKMLFKKPDLLKIKQF